ncbi:multiple epidermal growth factor-like domains protein 10 [Mercenaria mercenaria]|uniref:multiple epidermal growth factor-like domains protein 10 n=1 Tax=Mercenaria mercenaria TaxID=6596 RepID=UPI00234F1604|nr:multiple epidermal growth factor-like domains protein 10 [Mercenaria mercenaria]
MAPGLSMVVLLFALLPDTVLTECPAGCATCSSSTCMSCESSYYLSGGGCFQCHENCNSCNGTNDCTSCRANKYNLASKCTLNCADNCLNSECADDKGSCYQCTQGWYGQKCQHNCSFCANGLCDLRACTSGCTDGYFEYNTVSDSLCLKCPRDCKHCYNGTTCHVCNDNFYLYQFHSNGNSFVQCAMCSNNADCSKYCLIENCNQCQIQNGALVCTDCPAGQLFNGNTCVQNSKNCSEKCSTYCDDDDMCSGSCNDGWTGNTCTDQCESTCLTCEKTNGKSCQQCIGDYYTTNCSVACNPLCTKLHSKQTCRLDDGYCLNGCEYNSWGPACDQSCSYGCIDNGLSSMCERSSGICKHGCKDGYSGEKCDTNDTTSKTTFKPEDTSQSNITDSITETTLEPTEKSESQKDNKDIIIIVSAAGGGVLVLILIIVIVVCLAKGR